MSEDHKRSDNDLLSAYGDGELGARDVAAFEARLQAEPALRQALADYRDIDGTLRQALDMDLARSGWGDVETAVAELGERARVGPARRRWQWSNHFGRIAVALVAALGLGILAGQYWTASQYETQQARQKQLQRPLAAKQVARIVEEALSSQVSGRPFTWHDRYSGAFVSVLPVRTFRTQRGRLCREYVRTSKSLQSAESVRAVACKDDEDGWQTDPNAFLDKAKAN